ncbi:POTRA domain-containing protein [Deinococcus sp.]|uniref:BamA/OMP85 family outer membrane protein n=1 Tax=Deinococcus sp. TaxID=47478 RepID=UPI0025B8C50E|nr:POTRA domain-containing protein [Deinococcus sp.]
MRHPLIFAATLALSASAFAQTPAPTASTIQDVTVTGTTDLLANFVKAALSVQPGADLTTVNVRQVEQDVLATGYFKSAAAAIRTVNGQNVLAINAVTNPIIKSVDATGMTFLPADAFKSRIADLLNIAPGATLNTERIKQAKDALIQNYQQQGFPFTPVVTTTVKTAPDGSASVTFAVDETAPITQVQVEGVTLLPRATANDLFKPLYTAKKFSSTGLFAASDALQKAYNDAGYLQAGIAPGGVTLDKGVLKIKVTEGKVAATDTSALGTVTSALQTQEGQPLMLGKLQADVRTLANETGKPVGFALQPDPQDPGRITVYFGSADVIGGPIKSIVIAGNTKVPTATLQKALKTKVGDVYSPQLAQDDFAALRDSYRTAGYEISTRDAVTYNEGVLTFTIREVKLVSYELAWQGTHRTKDRIILRELPEPGQLFNLTQLRDALGRVSRLGYVNITGESVKNNDPQNPENITYVLQLSEAKTGIPVNLGLTYDTLAGGWGGGAGYENPNAFGLGHHFAVNLGAQQNQAGQNWVGSVNYTIPWLDLNFADFRKRRTSMTLGLGSSVGGNTALLNGDKLDTGRQYTVRSTGFSVNLGRSLTPNLGASLGMSINKKTYFLEPIESGEGSNISDAAATALLSKENTTARIEGGLSYDNTDNPEFPGRGTRASGLLAYNFGRSAGDSLGWTDIEVGVNKYYGFGGKISRQYGSDSYKNAFAVRLNYGNSFGSSPSGTGYYIGGSNPLPSRELRGLNDGQLFGPSYLTSSAELRHDFGLNNSVAQGLYGVVWADYGGVWDSRSNFSGNYGVGAGLQVNLGIGGARLPSLRFDYGFSPENPSNTGRFMFRMGNFW